MRLASPLIALIICTGCHARAPLPAGVRGAAHVDIRVDVRAHLRIRAEPQYEPPPPPEVRPEPVPLEGSGVVEFFGVPLEGAQDVVFLLDRSGSMIEPAQGQIAALSGSPPPPAPTDGASPEEAPPASAPAVVVPEGDAPAEPYAPPAHAPAEPYGAPAHAPAEPYGAPAHASAESPPSATDHTTDDSNLDAPAVAPDDPTAEPPITDPDAPSPAPDDPHAEPPPAATDEPAVAPAAPRKIDVARRELIDALTQLPAGTRLNVLFFCDWLEVYAPGLFPMEESHRADLTQFVEATEPSGPTALATAMRAAFMMGARHIVLLSDGKGNRGGGSDEILRDAREGMRAGVRIDTVGIGPDQDRPLLRALADESGGLYQAF